MHAGLGLEVAVGVVAFVLDGAGLDAGLVAFDLLGHGHLVAVALAPAHVHAHQHRAPVVGFGAAGTGIDGKDGAEVVALRAQHVLEFEVFHLAAGLRVGGVDLGAFRVQFLQDFQVFDGAFRPVKGADPRLDAAQSLEEGFRLLGVVPEIRGLAPELLLLHVRPLLVDPEAAAERFDTLLQCFYLLLTYHNLQR